MLPRLARLSRRLPPGRGLGSERVLTPPFWSRVAFGSGMVRYRAASTSGTRPPFRHGLPPSFETRQTRHRPPFPALLSRYSMSGFPSGTRHTARNPTPDRPRCRVLRAGVGSETKTRHRVEAADPFIYAVFFLRCQVCRVFVERRGTPLPPGRRAALRGQSTARGVFADRARHVGALVVGALGT